MKIRNIIFFVTIVCLNLGFSFARAQTYTFTPAGATGIDGPSQANINTAYAGTSLAGNVTVTNGIQYWHVPVSGTYKIEVYGANGYGTYGGRGAYMSGEFIFNANDELHILVGQEGGCCVGSGTNQYGGGGGSFVVNAVDTPLIIAGGGGGVKGFTSFQANADASITTSGHAGNGSTNGAAGTGGNGGGDAGIAGGGGGFYTDGTISPYGGKSFLNGGQGGTATTNGGKGGFGGGAGANSWDNNRGCGGGGYSGGGGAGSSATAPQAGGGGGSFNSGMNQTNTAALGTGDGLVVITLLAPAVSVPDNVGATSFPGFATGLCAGSQTVSVNIRNFGNNYVDSVKVGWEVNGVAQGSDWYPVDLDTFPVANYDTTVTLGTYVFGTPGATYNIKAWTFLPNNQADTVTSNDTASTTLVTRLAGTFTIDAGSPVSATNYQSFEDFTDALNTYGICGPVVANVVPGSGPYVETVHFGDISGASAINTIRVNGNGETVQFTNTSTDRQMLTLDGTKYLTIDSLNFKTLATDYGWGALITNGSAYDSIMHCEFDLSSITGTSSVNSNGICFSGSATSATTSGENGSNCYIGYNQVIGGTGSGGPYYGLTMYGASGDNMGNVIAHNTIHNFYYYGIYTYYGDPQVLYNDVNRSTKTSVTTCYMTYFYYSQPGSRIIGNRFHDPYGGTGSSTSTFYGPRVYYCQGSAANPVVVANNAVYNINQGGTVYAMYVYNSKYTLIYHNTITLDQALSSTSTNYGLYAYSTSTAYPGLEIKNNIVSITQGGTGTKYGFYYSSYINNIDDIQKNNFYVNSTQAGSQYYGYASSAYATQAAFQAAYPTLEVNSPNVDPQFTNPSIGNLLPTNYTLFGTGENLMSVVPEDILGNNRSALPTPGAYEMMPSGPDDAAIVEMIKPEGTFCPDSQQVSVSIMNTGTNNITSLQLHWQVDGVTQPVVNYNGTLSSITSTSGQSIDTVILGNAMFNAGAPNHLTIWTAMPNGVSDNYPQNDTLVDSAQAAQFVIALVSDTICINSDAILSLSPDDGYIDNNLTWQTSPDGMTWTDDPTAHDPHYTNSPVGIAPVWFRAHIVGPVSDCYSDSARVTIIDPVLLSVQDSSRCGPGTVTLTAQTGGNSVPIWYADTLQPPVGEGSPFETPYLTETDTFYVAAGGAGTGGSGGGGDSVNVPLATGTTTGVYQQMFTIHAINPLTINSFGIKCNNSTGTLTGWDIYYRPDDYTTVPGANTSSTGWILLSSETNIPSEGAGAYTEIASGLSLTIPMGDVYSFYISPASGTTHQYSTSSTGTVVASNADAELIAGNRGSALFSCTTSGGMPTVNVKYGNGGGCMSPFMAVIAHVYPNPDIDLGQDINQCIDSGSAIVLDAGLPPYGPQYLWDDGNTNRVRAVNASGTYNVRVTNSYGCVGSDTINVVVRHYPVVDLGNDTTVCEGTEVHLDAGNNGIEYFWSTGETTAGIDVDVTDDYSVMVTNDEGCTAMDTVHVTMSGQLPSIDYIQPYNNGAYTFTYTAVNPQNVIGYEWDFGDGSPTSSAQMPTHTYDSLGSYVVTLKVSSDCGYIYDSTTAHIVGIGEINADSKDVMIYPNPARERATITVNGNLKMKRVAVYDVVGKELLNIKVENAHKHILLLSGMASGLYTVKIATDKGEVTRKLEIIR